MLVSAYGSFKAGTNMQYDIPTGLDYLAGDNWETENEKQKKDWDAIFLQSPTGYLMVSDDGNEMTSEKSLYNAMLVLMMLYERGCLSRENIRQWLFRVFSGNFYFNEIGAIKDKAAWVQTIIEQAVGRLCRTRNKPRCTYILFDESMTKFFDFTNVDKSLTKEFRVLASYINSNYNKDESFELSEEQMLCNDANTAQRLLDQMRSSALHYTPHNYDDDDFDDDESNDLIPYRIHVNQVMNQSYKQTIIRKPVITSVDELSEEEKYLTFVHKCYGLWKRDDEGGYNFSYDEQYKKVCPKGKGRLYYISPHDVRLDVLMKNDIIRKHFEKNGFATNWAQDGLILHPQILRTDYAGEIGEEAFKALVLHYTDCSEESIKHLGGKDYELADFVICRSDGSFKIAFDVKNMNPKADHNDKFGDMPTSQKRELKRKRLGCELITVNLLQLPQESIDAIREISGLLDENGNIVIKGIETLRKLINN